MNIKTICTKLYEWARSTSIDLTDSIYFYYRYSYALPTAIRLSVLLYTCLEALEILQHPPGESNCVSNHPLVARHIYHSCSRLDTARKSATVDAAGDLMACHIRQDALQIVLRPCRIQ
jgi:hypothetical protein